MKRREFLKTAEALGAAMAMPNIVSANGDNVRRFRVNYIFDIKYYEKSYPARLWNPLPFNALIRGLSL